MTVIRALARPMLASMFVVGGVNALRNSEAMAERARPVTDRLVPLAQRALPNVKIPSDPQTLVRATGAVHVVAGLALATGRSPRLAALTLAATMMPTTLAGHPYWEESEPGAKTNQKVQFFKNLSLTGGLLLASVDTEGRPGIAWRMRHAGRDARREARRLQRTARREAKLATRSLT